jgi:hypothetical protein
LHARSSRASHIDFGMVTHKDGSCGTDIESLQCTVKDPGIWFADAFGIGYQNRVKHRRQAKALQFAALHAKRAVGNDAELQSRGAKARQRLGGVREEHAGTRKPSAVIVQQRLSQSRRNPEPRGHTSKQWLPWSIPVAIKLYERLDVLLLVCILEVVLVRKPFPLIPNKPFEASPTVKQGSV